MCFSLATSSVSLNVFIAACHNSISHCQAAHNCNDTPTYPDLHATKQVQNALEMRLAFLTRNDLLRAGDLSGKLDLRLKKALEVLEEMNFSKAAREFYENYLKWLRIEANGLKKAEAKGRAKGKQKEKIAIAKNMLLQMGLAMDTVQKATGLSQKELERLQKGDAKN